MEERKKGEEEGEGKDFPGYQRIYESTQHWQPSKNQFKKLVWVASEKVHGANFCFVVFHNDEGGEPVILGAKRRELLGEEEDFFGHKLLIPKIQDKIIKIYHLVMASDTSDTKPKRVFIFGGTVHLFSSFLH